MTKEKKNPTGYQQHKRTHNEKQKERFSNHLCTVILLRFGGQSGNIRQKFVPVSSREAGREIRTSFCCPGRLQTQQCSPQCMHNFPVTRDQHSRLWGIRRHLSRQCCWVGSANCPTERKGVSWHKSDFETALPLLPELGLYQ